MKVLVIGSGGREHALAWKLAQSPHVAEVIVAPGNAGTAIEPRVRNADVAATDIEGLIALALEEDVALTVVGPEGPLVLGVVDRFRAAGLACFGPRRVAAQLEGSKAFAKEFLARHNIPTARYAVFTELEPALAHVRRHGAPIVIKADGLAAGKGVVVALTLGDAELALRDMLGAHSLGDACARVVIEEFLEGEEASYIVIADGTHALPMATSQDHKRVGEADTGPNTGGMGAYSPAPVVTPDVERRILDEVIGPTLAGMAAEGAPFIGFLYAGLMIAADGAPKVLEYNCRLGDPETQPLLMRLESDLVELCLAAIEGRLDQVKATWDPRPALGVVMAAGGYPDSYETGHPIRGLDAAMPSDVKVFQAGTKADGSSILTNGGRVLCVTALGDSVSAAQSLAYRGVEKIAWEGCRFRRDIGYRAIARERSS